MSLRQESPNAGRHWTVVLVSVSSERGIAGTNQGHRPAKEGRRARLPRVSGAYPAGSVNGPSGASRIWLR